MHILKHGSVSLLFVMIAVSGFAQSAPAADDQATPSSAPAPRAAHRSHGMPCWRQADITPDMVNQRWKIEDDEKVRIAAVCHEPTTGPQQKHDKIEQIHANTKQEIANLIPADKLAKFNKCQVEWEKTHPAPASEKKLGPCGGTIPANANAEGMEHHHDGAPMKQ